MIQELYLKRALNIRKEYKSIIGNVEKYEKFSQDLSSLIKNKMDGLNTLQTEINSGRISDIDVAKNKLMGIVMEIEDEANKIESIIDGFNKRIEGLKTEEMSLYKDIKAKYPELSDNNIKAEIQDYLQKMKVS